jgi:hypothetical protein
MFRYVESARDKTMTSRIPVALVLTVLFSNDLLAQGFTESDSVERKHRDYMGKPCLVTSGVSRPLASSRRISNHSVSLDNHCVDRIKVKVCYYKTDDCKDVDVPGNSRKEQIIGTFPALQLFRYEVKEQF